MERQIITVDIAPGNSQVERLGSSQGDIGRPLGVYIIQNGVALDCSAYSAELYILKPDGKFYTTQATVDATVTNLIKWETAEQETPVAGACAAQIRITAGDDDIGTARFVEFVEASPCDMGSASESEVALLTEYVRQARESATSAGRNATTASDAASSASGSASTATTAANTATQAATAATTAADRAEAVEESIPADYTQLSDDVTGLKSAFRKTIGEVLYSGEHTYSSSPSNWQIYSFMPTPNTKFAIRLIGNTVPIEVALSLSGSWRVLTTITDDKLHVIDVPANVIDHLILTFRGTAPVTISCIVYDVTIGNLTADVISTLENIDKLEDYIPTSLKYGNNGETQTIYDFNKNFSACPCKKADASGKVISLRIKNYASGTVEIYVGEVDQLYLFVPRTSFTINVDEGEKVYDVSDRNIFINEGEQILIKFSGGKTAFASVTGEPEGDSSFYYSSYGNMQLQVYGAQKAAVFGFGYTVASSIINEQGAQIDDNTKSIDTLTENVNVLQANFNVVMDRQGNKYKMIVQNGVIALLAMNFHHVLCVGNSYTTHPTTTDTESDYRNNLWWGHWSMAASAKQTAWTTLLQTALRQKVNDAVVTPVFGRRYETSYNTYTLNNPGTFTYWDGAAWQSLSDNLSDFSDVDGIVFFLGANYSGNDWYTLYSAMVEKFLTWFPNATLFCCSCAANSMQAKDEAIQQVADEQLGTYISMVGIRGPAKLGAYVYGDDNNLHQIDNSAVANHFGDYGEYVILDRICSAMGYTNNTALYDITIASASGVIFTVVSTKTVSGAVVSIFADVESGTTLSSITVTDANSNNITVTDHGETSYGRVFTFVMPSANVTVTGNVS